MSVVRRKERVKRQKGAIALFVVLMLVANLFPVTAGFGADYATIAVGNPVEEAPEDGYAPGATFRVPVTLTDNPGFAGATLTVKYDTEAFELTAFDYSASSGALFAGGILFPPNVEGGTILYLMMGGNKTGDGVLYYLDFRVKDDAPGGSYEFYISPEDATGLPLAVNFSDWEAQAVPCVFPSTYITVQGDEPPEPPGPATVSLGSADDVLLGETFTVPVSIADNPGFAAAAFTLDYDDEALEIVSVSATGALFSDGLIWDENTPARVGYVKINNDPVIPPANITSDGKLFEVTFKAKDGATPGAYQIGLALTDGLDKNFINANAEAVSVDFAGTSVTVLAPTPQISLGSVDDVLPGETFTVPVSIEDNPGFAAAAFTLGYDVAALEIVSVSATGALFSDGLIWDENTPARVGYVKINNDPVIPPANITSDGKLFEVTFKAKDGATPGAYQIGLALTDGLDKNFINANAEAVTVDFAGTSVKVVVPAGTVSLWVGDVSGYPGSQVVVPVTIQENPGFDIGIFDISFGEGLELTSFDFTDTLVSASQVVYDLSQLNRIALLASEDFATHIEGNGVLFNMIFTIKADAAGDSYSIELGLMNGQSTNFAVYNGAVDNEGYPIPTAISSVAFVPGSVEALDQTIPTVDDLLYDLPQTVVYDGASHAVPVASAGSELGAITVYYTGSGSTAYGKTTEPPTGAGTYLVTVDIAPRGIYGQALGIELGLLTIAKAAAPTITWPEASAITYEQALSASTLSFTANDFGSFGWASSVDLTTIPNAGSPAYPVTFTPSAATLNNYEAISPLTQNVAVTVNKAAAPTITWPEESVVKEGSDLSTAALTGGSTEYGSFAWTDPTIIPPLAGGSYSVTFTPSAATLNNYEAISPLTQNLGVTVRGSGDLDNDGYTTAFDVLYHLFIINGLRPTPPSSSLDFQLADMDEDGSLTVADTILLLRKAMGLS